MRFRQVDILQLQGMSAAGPLLDPLTHRANTQSDPPILALRLQARGGAVARILLQKSFISRRKYTNCEAGPLVGGSSILASGVRP